MEGWFLDFLPDLNQNDPEVARYLIQNTLWWIGTTGIDGIRMDTWQYVPNRFWSEWTAAVKKEFPNIKVVGEVKDGDVVHTSFFQGGRVRFDGVDSGLDSLLDFPSFIRFDTRSPKVKRSTRFRRHSPKIICTRTPRF